MQHVLFAREPVTAVSPAWAHDYHWDWQKQDMFVTVATTLISDNNKHTNGFK